MNPNTPPANLLTKLEERTQRAQKGIAAAQTELEKEAAEAQLLQSELSRLQTVADRCADQLLMSDSQFAQFKELVAEARATAVNSWGVSGYLGQTIFHQSPYHHLPAYEAAIADFPRVRAELVVRAEDASAALTKFEKEHL